MAQGEFVRQVKTIQCWPLEKTASERQFGKRGAQKLTRSGQSGRRNGKKEQSQRLQGELSAQGGWQHSVSCCCCCWITSVVSDSVRPHRQQPTRLPRPWDSPGKNTGVGCHFLFQCMKGKSESEVAQSCPTLSDPMDCMQPTRLLRPWDFPGKCTGLGSVWLRKKKHGSEITFGFESDGQPFWEYVCG